MPKCILNSLSKLQEGRNVRVVNEDLLQLKFAIKFDKIEQIE